MMAAPLGAETPRPDYPGAWDVCRHVYGAGLPSWARVCRTPTGWATWAGGTRYETAEQCAAEMEAR